MTREELLQIAKPILFNTPMTIAILENRKGATRRVIKPQYMEFADGTTEPWDSVERCESGDFEFKCRNFTRFIRPRYKAGDILYVRETWKPAKKGFFYKADWERDGIGDIGKWKPSIHMPKEAARLFLKVTDVRVERVQDITEEQAIKEGVEDPYDYQDSWFYERPSMQKLTYHIAAFAGLWFSTLPKYYQDYMAWEANPWVFVYEFERAVPDEQK